MKKSQDNSFEQQKKLIKN